MMNRFKELDLVDRVPEELWLELHTTVLESVNKTIPEKKKHKKAKWLCEEGLHTAAEKEKQEAKEKGKDIPN